jgi:hypothetical protein
MQNFFANWLGPLPPGVTSTPANTLQIVGSDGKVLTKLASEQQQPIAAPQHSSARAAAAPVAPPAAPPQPAPEPEKKKKGWF